MSLHSLSLLAGTPIPVPELRLTFHQPRVRDIASLGESLFYRALSLFSVNKEGYLESERARLTKHQDMLEKLEEEMAFMSDFQLILRMVEADAENKVCFEGLLYLILPNLSKCFSDEQILILTLKDPNEESGSRQMIVNDREFSLIKKVVEDMFQSDEINKPEFNPANDKAAEIAEKIMARRRKIAAEKGLLNQEHSALATAISVLSTSNYLDLNSVLNYTVPQLHYQVERSRKLVEYQTQMTLGAFGGLKDVEISDWTSSI